jgi:hypothetical protein
VPEGLQLELNSEPADPALPPRPPFPPDPELPPNPAPPPNPELPPNPGLPPAPPTGSCTVLPKHEFEMVQVWSDAQPTLDEHIVRQTPDWQIVPFGHADC